MSSRPLRGRGGLAVALAVLVLALVAGAGAALAAGGGATVGEGTGQTGTTTTTSTTTTTTTTPPRSKDPLAGNGVWIWNIARSSGGDPAAIAARAKKAHLRFLVVKAANGSDRWTGFTAAFVSALRAKGLRVCGYQRVMPHGPKSQATVLASQIRRTGADCAVIDAESELEGRYLTADAYMKTLRAGLGSRFPIALTSFPWIGYHPTFPYSVFLGSGGAQVNLPQIYWKDIGVPVSTGFANTYAANSVFGRPIRPIGQLYQKPSAADIGRFRTAARQYGSTGVSWWDWEEASSTGWSALYKRDPATKTRRTIVPPTLAAGARSDLVRWARTRLRLRGAKVSRGSAVFDSRLTAAVLAYQADKGLPVSGRVDPATWKTLIPVYAYGG